MQTLEQVSGELLGRVIFGDSEKHFSASDFTFGIDERTHKPIVQFKCRFESNGNAVEDYVVRKLDFEDRRLDRTIECGSVIESLPEYEAIAEHIDYILEACGLTREKLTQAALNGKTQIEADAVTDIMHGINESYLSQKDATVEELREALNRPMNVPEALKEYVAKELQMFIDNDIPLPDGRDDYREPPQYGIAAEPLVNFFEKSLSLHVFNTTSIRLRINNLEPIVVEEYKELKPAVRIDADVIRASGADNCVVEVPIDYIAYPGRYESDEDTLMNGVDVILEAFGLDRDRVLMAVEAECLGFTYLTESSVEALKTYLKDGISTSFGDERINEEWADLKEQIDAELSAGKKLRLRFAYDRFYSNVPFYNRVIIEDEDQTEICSLQPKVGLTEIQQLVLDQFSQQKMHPEDIPGLIVQEKLFLPKALLQAAQERYKDCFEEQAKKFSLRR